MLTATILSDSHVSATHEIGDSSRQQTLGLGPTGRVHKSTLPDNRAFWESVNATEFTSRGSSRREVFRAVAYYASLTDARVCFASVATLAKRASLGTTATRSQLRALELGGYIETQGERSGGRSGTRYRLPAHRPNPTLTVAQPNAYRWVNPTLTVAEEVIEEGTEEEVQKRTLSKLSECSPDPPNKGKRRLRTSPHTAQQRMVAAIAVKLGLSELLTFAGLEEFAELENHKKQALIKRLLKAEAWHDRRAAKAKDAPRLAPDPPALSDEARARLEEQARENGYHKRDGQWVRGVLS